MKNKKYLQFISAYILALNLLGCFASPETLTQDGKLKTAQFIFEKIAKNQVKISIKS